MKLIKDVEKGVEIVVSKKDGVSVVSSHADVVKIFWDPYSSFSTHEDTPFGNFVFFSYS